MREAGGRWVRSRRTEEVKGLERIGELQSFAEQTEEDERGGVRMGVDWAWERGREWIQEAAGGFKRML